MNTSQRLRNLSPRYCDRTYIAPTLVWWETGQLLATYFDLIKLVQDQYLLIWLLDKLF